MFQFEVLSGDAAGSQWLARRFPLQLGRSAASDFQIEQPGVYDQHATFDLDATGHLALSIHPPAQGAVNGEPVTTAVLRNGDLLTFGSARLRLWLAPVQQRGLRLGELLLWGIWFGVAAAQLALLRWLWS